MASLLCTGSTHRPGRKHYLCQDIRHRTPGPVDVVASPRRAEITLLRDAPVFRELDDAQLLAVAAEAQRQTYAVGELIDMPSGEHLVTIVVAGGVRLFRNSLNFNTFLEKSLWNPATWQQ